MRQRKICAPSNGGMGSKLKAPVNKFAAKKALHQMVARRERQKTAQTASKMFTPGPAAASKSCSFAEKCSFLVFIQNPVMVTSMCGSRWRRKR